MPWSKGWMSVAAFFSFGKNIIIVFPSFDFRDSEGECAE
jgi:hypothetical protein